jgi:hypothetical protein
LDFQNLQIAIRKILWFEKLKIKKKNVFEITCRFRK